MAWTTFSTLLQRLQIFLDANCKYYKQYPSYWRYICDDCKASNECSHLQSYISLCFSLNENYLREMMGMVFSITEINKNSLLMPNITLGYVIYDTCYAIAKVIEAGLTIVGSRVKSIRNTKCSSTAVIGPFSSRLSLNLNNMLGLFDIPQVTTTMVLLNLFLFYLLLSNV